MQQGAPASPAWQLLHELAAAGEGGDTLDAAQLGILVDLCASTLRQGEEWGFSDEKLSVLLGLVKETHAASVRGRLTLEASFRFFRDSLLNHSVQRCVRLLCGVVGARRDTSSPNIAVGRMSAAYSLSLYIHIVICPLTQPRRGERILWQSQRHHDRPFPRRRRL
jgi:hypothetical protein